MTLAHELGHGVHQSLSSSQGEILANTPLTLAETASVFGEMLTFQKMLSISSGEMSQKQLLASKVEDMINTVVRQISFYDFECRLHYNRQNGELTPDQINKIWLDVSHESLGPIFNYMKGYETFWAYVPHFIHSPFYVYAYAFGDGLVNALYSTYQKGTPNFEDKYFALLAAGGSKHHSDLLKPFNLDASDPTFWSKGLNLISSMIDDLESMES
jgi:oligoendopeptidase F